MADSTHSADAHQLELPEPEALAARFRQADPFPHAVIDGFLDRTLVQAIVAEFPTPRSMEKHYRDRAQAKKSTSANADTWGPTTQALMQRLNTPETLAWLSAVTGIDNLIADPTFEGGGLHQIRCGGKLGVHADFNRQVSTGHHRRLNLLIYLNEHWQEEWGGHLELWDETMSRPVERVAPVAGRAVLFETTSTSFHGHPDPLDCPADVTRKSLALYYYSEAPADLEYHSTLFQTRPDSDDRPHRPTIKQRTVAVLRRLHLWPTARF